MHRVIYIIIAFLCVVSSSAQTRYEDDYIEKFSKSGYNDFPGINNYININEIDIDLLNIAVFFETNSQRYLNGVKPFKHCYMLETAAEDHSKDMVKYNFFSHNSPVPGKHSLIERIKKTGIQKEYLGENITYNYILKLSGISYMPPSSMGDFYKSDGVTKIETHTYKSFAVEIVNDWMKSPGHRENILNKQFNMLGCGCAFYYSGTGVDRIPALKCTQCFSD